MKRFVKPLTFAVLTFVCLLSIADVTKGKTAKDLPNMHQVNANLYRGGQPTAAGFVELQKMGIKTVIDLRESDERAKKEKAMVEAAGMRFINVPLDPWLAPNSVFLEDLMKYFDKADNQPVFVHCRRGSDRTGVAIAVYRITHDGWDDEQASEEAKKFGLGWWQVWMKDYIHNYYRDYKQKQTGH